MQIIAGCIQIKLLAVFPFSPSSQNTSTKTQWRHPHVQLPTSGLLSTSVRWDPSQWTRLASGQLHVKSFDLHDVQTRWYLFTSIKSCSIGSSVQICPHGGRPEQARRIMQGVT